MPSFGAKLEYPHWTSALAYHLKHLLMVSELSADGNNTKQYQINIQVKSQQTRAHGHHQSCLWVGGYGYGTSFSIAKLTSVFRLCSFLYAVIIYLKVQVNAVLFVHTRKYVCYLFIQTHQDIMHALALIIFCGILGHLCKIKDKSHTVGNNSKFMY